MVPVRNRNQHSDETKKPKLNLNYTYTTSNSSITYYAPQPFQSHNGRQWMMSS